MSVEKVELERNNKHACTGLVMSCNETGRTIASFWHDDDAEDVMLKINKYDELVNALKKVLDDSEIGIVPKSHLDKIEGILKEA